MAAMVSSHPTGNVLGGRPARQNWGKFDAHKWGGFNARSHVVLLLAGTLMWPFPFSHIIPALVIMLISFAYLEEDGALLCISLAAALLSFSITAATVWATVSATGLIERLWTGA